MAAHALKEWHSIITVLADVEAGPCPTPEMVSAAVLCMVASQLEELRNAPRAVWKKLVQQQVFQKVWSVCARLLQLQDNTKHIVAVRTANATLAATATALNAFTAAGNNSSNLLASLRQQLQCSALEPTLPMLLTATAQQLLLQPTCAHAHSPAGSSEAAAGAAVQQPVPFDPQQEVLEIDLPEYVVDVCKLLLSSGGLNPVRFNAADTTPACTGAASHLAMAILQHLSSPAAQQERTPRPDDAQKELLRGGISCLIHVLLHANLEGPDWQEYYTSSSNNNNSNSNNNNSSSNSTSNSSSSSSASQLAGEPPLPTGGHMLQCLCLIVAMQAMVPFVRFACSNGGNDIGHINSSTSRSSSRGSSLPHAAAEEAAAAAAAAQWRPRSIAPLVPAAYRAMLQQLGISVEVAVWGTLQLFALQAAAEPIGSREITAYACYLKLTIKVQEQQQQAAARAGPKQGRRQQQQQQQQKQSQQELYLQMQPELELHRLMYAVLLQWALDLPSDRRDYVDSCHHLFSISVVAVGYYYQQLQDRLGLPHKVLLRQAALAAQQQQEDYQQQQQQLPGLKLHPDPNLDAQPLLCSMIHKLLQAWRSQQDNAAAAADGQAPGAGNNHGGSSSSSGRQPAASSAGNILRLQISRAACNKLSVALRDICDRASSATLLCVDCSRLAETAEDDGAAYAGRLCSAFEDLVRAELAAAQQQGKRGGIMAADTPDCNDSDSDDSTDSNNNSSSSSHSNNKSSSSSSSADMEALSSGVPLLAARKLIGGPDAWAADWVVQAAAMPAGYCDSSSEHTQGAFGLLCSMLKLVVVLTAAGDSSSLQQHLPAAELMLLQQDCLGAVCKAAGHIVYWAAEATMDADTDTGSMSACSSEAGDDCVAASEDRHTGAPACSGSSSSSDFATAAGDPDAVAKMLPWVVLLGRCLLHYGRLLQATQATSAAVRESLAVDQSVPILIAWLTAEGVETQLAALGYTSHVQLCVEQLKALKAARQAVVAALENCHVQHPRAAVAALAAQLQTVGQSLALFAIPCACNNVDCSNVSGSSEAQLVGGRSCICAGCRTARYCSKQCQRAAWQQHKPVCKALAKVQQSAAGGGGIRRGWASGCKGKGQA